MAQDVAYKDTYLAFTGSQTKTVSIDANHHALVVWMDIFVAAARTIDIKIGSKQIIKGTIAAENSPIQLRLGSGRGSGVAGDDITVIMNGAADVFIGYTEHRVLP